MNVVRDSNCGINSYMALAGSVPYNKYLLSLLKSIGASMKGFLLSEVHLTMCLVLDSVQQYCLGDSTSAG